MRGEKKFNVLVYGSGGREHALAWKIAQSPLLNKLFLALPNDGFKNLGEEIIFTDFEDLAKKCVTKKIDLAVIGPEDPLSKGLVDILNAHGIKCIGANKNWAQLESSKKYAKEFMIKHGISTAKYLTMTSKNDLDDILAQFTQSPVLKADGLAAGKGVHLSKTMDEAKQVLEEFLDGKYGEASTSVVVEEFLEGEELSLISIFDGKTLLPLETARDYKRLLDRQQGPNTGGMGAYCPVELTTAQQKDLKNYIKQLESALLSEKADFVGIVYSGLMLTKDGIKVLEYNMRFGDPETQSLMYHLESDILEIFIKATEKKLHETKPKWKSGTTIAVVVASEGYPENPKKGCEINGLQEACADNETHVFYAGVKNAKCKMQNAKCGSISLVSNGGRVLSICSNGVDINKIREKIYKTIEEIDFADKIYRCDIGLNEKQILITK